MFDFITKHCSKICLLVIQINKNNCLQKINNANNNEISTNR